MQQCEEHETCYFKFGDETKQQNTDESKYDSEPNKIDLAETDETIIQHINWNNHTNVINHITKH